MFDKPVNIAEVYGVIPPHPKRKLVGAARLNGKKAGSKEPYPEPDEDRYVDGAQTYKEYIAMRKKEEFKLWWRRQYASQHALCYYCKGSLKTKRINVEHIVPMSRGGTNNRNNMVLSCSDCNRKKGSKLLPKRLRKSLRQELHKQIKLDKEAYIIQKIKDQQIIRELNGTI